MTCRETLTLDLADFLARPTAPEFAAFRAHYPRCGDCAAEVRAWTELHVSLSGATHPTPDMLLRYEDGGLADADRHRVARHLAACAPCRDELRALAVFDRDAAPAAARVTVSKSRRWSFRLPRLVLHPALAYGLVLALLFYPAFRSSFSERKLTEMKQAPVSSGEPASGSKPDRFDAPPREERAALAKRAAPSQPAAEAPAAASARAKDDTSEREIDAAAPVERLRALSSDLAGSEPGRLAARVELLPGPSAEEKTLRIPVLNAGEVEVRVLDARSERELRQRVAAVADRVEIHVPRVWLVPGPYRVEVRDPRGTTAPEVFTLVAEP